MSHFAVDLVKLFEGLGAIVAIDMDNFDKDLRQTISVHQNILKLSGNNSNIQLIKSNVDLTNINAEKLKGARLSNEVMNVAVPAFSLQLYCNPTLYWLAQPAFFVLSAISQDTIDIQSLRRDFETLRKIFIYEFVLYPGFCEADFHQNLQLMLNLEIFKIQNETFHLNHNSNYTNLLLSAIAPFLNCYLNTSKVILGNLKDDFTEKDVFVAVQSHLEGEILKGECKVHPYSLCLDSINMVIISLCNSACLYKKKQ